MTFLQEIRRRNVVKVTLAYLAISWTVVEVTGTVLSYFSVATWVMQALVVFFAAGLPIVVVLAWIYDLTPEGVQRTDDMATRGVLTQPAGRKLDFLIIGFLSLALIAVAIDQYVIPASNARLGPRSVIVLPFSGNEDEQSEILADGLFGEVLTQLYKIEDLTTIGGATSRQYRGTDKTIAMIADEVGVAAVVSGHLIRLANVLRFDVELLDPRTSEMLWVNSYELPHTVQGIFDVQSDIAFKIARALKAQLSPGEQRLITDRTVTSEAAYDHFLIGEGYRRKTILDKAIAEYEQATREDPSFAAAWAALARTRALAHFTDLAPATMQQAEFALEQARQLAPDAAETLLAEAVMLGLSNRFEESAELYRRVLELQPGAVEPVTALAADYTVQLRLDEARMYAERAVSLDPMNIEAVWQLAFIHAWSWNFEKARLYYDRVLAMESGSPHPWAYALRYQVYLWGLGDRAAAAKILANAPANFDSLYEKIELAYLDRDMDKVAELLESTEGERRTRHYWLAKFNRYGGNSELQTKYGESMRVVAEAILEAELSRGAIAADVEAARSWVAVAMSLAGNESEAIRTMEMAVSRVSTNRDRLNSAPVYFSEVMMYIYLGQIDVAIQRLRSLLSWAKPFWLTPYRLKVDPDLDSLRGHPEFEALLAELTSAPN